MKKILQIILPVLILVVMLSPFSALATTSFFYTNVSGNQIHVPVKAQVIPAGATAQCKDGSYSFSAHRQGTCSHQKGVKTWYK